MTPRAFASFAATAASLVTAASVLAQPVTVTHEGGLLNVSCNNAPLSEVFEAIGREAGVELTLEDEVKAKRLTADLEQVPVAMAVQQLLEGAGVNYVIMMNPSDWGRVGRIYVGAGGGGPARTAAPAAARRPAYQPPEPAQDEFYDDQDALDALRQLEDMGDQLADEDPNAVSPDEPADFGGQDAFPTNPPGSSPVPSYLPPTPSFPRSRFTPGLPGNAPAQQPQTQQQPQQQTPPATYPFTDPFGRPIPVPPELNQQQRQQQQEQQQNQEDPPQ